MTNKRITVKYLARVEGEGAHAVFEDDLVRRGLVQLRHAGVDLVQEQEVRFLAAIRHPVGREQLEPPGIPVRHVDPRQLRGILLGQPDVLHRQLEVALGQLVCQAGLAHPGVTAEQDGGAGPERLPDQREEDGVGIAFNGKGCGGSGHRRLQISAGAQR